MQEHIKFKNKRNLFLSAILNNGRSNSPLLILVHGFAGNKDENGLFIEAEDYFSSKGLNTFRFDLEGAGESEGDFKETTLKKQESDLESAISHIIALYPSIKIGVVGFSLGASIAVLNNNPKIDFYIFWSPALYPASNMFPRYNTSEILGELHEKGYVQKGNLKVGTKIIDDFKACDLEKDIKNLTKPVLLVHGTKDPRINYQSTIKAKPLFPNSSLEIIEGANHSYKENSQHRKILFDKTYEWLQSQIDKF